MIRKRRVIAGAVVVTVTAIVACLGPTLSQTEQANIVTMGSGYDFGPTQIGSSKQYTVIVTPATSMMSSSDTIGSGGVYFMSPGQTTCGPFSLMLDPLPVTIVQTCTGSGSEVMPSAVAPQNGDVITCTQTSYMFVAQYTPTLAIASSCTVTIMGSSNVLQFQLMGSGMAAAKAIDVTPMSISIGQVPVGSTGSQPLHVHNAGSTPLGVSAITTSAPFTTNFTPTTIPVGATNDYNVTCTPTAQQAYVSSLTVTSEAGATTVMPVKCDGIVTNLGATPSPVDLSTTRVNEVKTPMVTITSSGAPTTITSVAIVPTVTGVPITITSGMTGNHTLGSGSSEVFNLKYSPTAAQTVTELAKLRITHSGGMIRDVVINGGALDTVLSVNPDAIDFGPVCQSKTAMKDVEVTTGAPGGIHMNAIAGGDLPSAPFTFAAKPGTSLPFDMRGNAGTVLDFTASVMPTTQTGMISSRVVLTTDMPVMSSRNIDLKAEVLPAGAGASPSTLDFGGILKNTTSTAIMTTLRNCGTDSIDVTASISGMNAADFSIVIPSELTKTLAPNETVQFGVVMRSDKPGAKIASLDFTSASGKSSVALIGTALGAGDGNGDDDRETYYECNTGGPGAGLWALVVYVGLRRRRRK